MLEAIQLEALETNLTKIDRLQNVLNQIQDQLPLTVRAMLTTMGFSDKLLSDLDEEKVDNLIEKLYEILDYIDGE